MIGAKVNPTFALPYCCTEKRRTMIIQVMMITSSCSTGLTWRKPSTALRMEIHGVSTPSLKIMAAPKKLAYVTAYLVQSGKADTAVDLLCRRETKAKVPPSPEASA
eukprot:gb/GEZN01032354.1/.p2 GENE.gb/GEZN01032354.1/~~gb/GEZN01032354.1/.p2  ORF type:complete len:106 (+),score=13.31 gb/GEZN01032354.1/:2-319(+)